MQEALLIIQVVTAIVLSVLILIQTKGTGFGRVWGGSSSFTRRGLEKTVFRSTFVVSAIFVVVSILQLVV
ncbi:preprotein translocase subunit SecG [Patescibacteria group bacterium]